MNDLPSGLHILLMLIGICFQEQQVQLVNRAQVVRLDSLDRMDVLEPLEHRDHAVTLGHLDHKGYLGIQVPLDLREEVVLVVSRVLQGTLVLQDH